MESWSGIVSSDVEVSTFTLRLLILLFVITVEHFVSIRASYHPGSLLKFLAIKLASKSKHRLPKQQKISGMLSTIMLLSFSLLITYAILTFATYPWFFEAIFLLLALNSTAIIKSTKGIYNSLNKDKKSLAREQLHFLCVRDTKLLSTMGVVKGTIEGAIQRFSIHYFSPIIIYLIGGVYCLVFYSLVTSLALYWNPKQKKFRYFGRPVNKIKDFITLPLHCLLTVLISVLFGFKYLSMKRNSWHRFGSGALLTTTANAMHRELGGTVMYNDIKVRRPKLSSNPAPITKDLKDLSRLLTRLRQSIVLIVSITTLFALLLS